jgi:hypothetical protein
LLLILYGPMRSTHSLSHGIASASFSGKSPYFLDFFSLTNGACLYSYISRRILRRNSAHHDASLQGLFPFKFSSRSSLSPLPGM